MYVCSVKGLNSLENTGGFQVCIREEWGAWMAIPKTWC